MPCRHTTRFLVVWLTAMPYCIWGQLHWFTVPVSVVVAFLLLAIEEIGGAGGTLQPTPSSSMGTMQPWRQPYRNTIAFDASSTATQSAMTQQQGGLGKSPPQPPSPPPPNGSAVNTRALLLSQACKLRSPLAFWLWR
jgi:hypothetical protein